MTAADDFKTHVLILGNSHTQALKEAYTSMRGEMPDKDDSDIQFDFIVGSASEKPGVPAGFDQGVALERAGALQAKDILAISIAGAFHNILGLIKHPEPFDLFPVSSHDTRDVQIIPTNAIREQIEVLTRQKTNIRNVRKGTAASVYHLSTPPPKESEAFIKTSTMKYRGSIIATAGVSPSGLRLKLWELEMDVLKNVCASWGIGFVPAPAECRTESGFLKPELYGPDATHGSAAYGKLVISQLAQLAMSRREELGKPA